MMRLSTLAPAALAAALLAGCQTVVTPENADYRGTPPKAGCLFAEIKAAGRTELVSRMNGVKLALTDDGAVYSYLEGGAPALTLRHAGCAEEGCRFERTDAKGRPGAYYLWRVKDPETGRERAHRALFGRIHGRGLFPPVEFRR